MRVFLDRAVFLFALGWCLLIGFGGSKLPEDIQIFGTLAIVTANFFLSMLVYYWTKKAPVWICLGQLCLFGMFHVTLYKLVQPTPYTTAHAPGFFDWLLFIVAHVLRAVDLLDMIESYNINIQTIKHNGVVPASVLVYMHIIVDVLMLSIIIERLRAWWGESTLPDSRKQRLIKTLITIRRYAFYTCLVLIFLTASSQHWAKHDYFRWPLEQFLRLLDFGDAFNLYDWQIHSVEPTLWNVSLGVVFRFLLGMYVVGWVFKAVRGCLTMLVLFIMVAALVMWWLNRKKMGPIIPPKSPTSMIIKESEKLLNASAAPISTPSSVHRG